MTGDGHTPPPVTADTSGIIELVRLSERSHMRRSTVEEASGPATSRPITRKVLRDDVYDELLERLLDGEYPPGTALSIDRLARELGVSPTPVREALVQLEHTGLVSRAALKGYRVAAPLSAAQMAELIDARSIVEVAAMERAAEHADELVPTLRAAHDHHATVVASLGPAGASARGMRAYFDADWQFHLLIVEASGNRYLGQMLEGLGAHVHRLRQSVGAGVSDAQHALAEHAAILEALAAGDEKGAVAAMRDHLAAVKTRATLEG